MNNIPPTQATLLLRLTAGADQAAWEQFVEIYAPVVFQFVRRRGLQESDAADITQDVLLRVAESFRRQKYDAARGRFRGWLLTITRHELADWFAGGSRRESAGGGSAAQQVFAQLADNEDESRTWRRDYEQRLFAWAAERVQAEVQPATWNAFWKTAVEARSGQEVAAELQMSVAAVYLAKSRVLKRMRELIREVDDGESD